MNEKNKKNIPRDQSKELSLVSIKNDEQLKNNHPLFLKDIKIQQNSGNLGDEEEFQDMSIMNFYMNQQEDQSQIKTTNYDNQQNTDKQIPHITFLAPPNSASRMQISLPLLNLIESRKSNENKIDSYMDESRYYYGDNTPQTVQNYFKTEAEGIYENTPIDKGRNFEGQVLFQSQNKKKINQQQNDTPKTKMINQRGSEQLVQRKQRVLGLGKSFVVKNIAKLFDDISKKKLRLNVIMREFIKKLESLSKLRRANNLNELDYEMINDKTCFQKVYTLEKDKYSSKPKYSNSKISGMFKLKIKVFMPTDSFVIYWGVFSHIFFYIFLFIYSILIFFAPDLIEKDIVFWYFSVASTLQCIDILIKLNTAFFNKDIIVKKREILVMRYIKQYFVFDAINLLIIIQKLYQYDVFYLSGQKALIFDILGLLKALSLNSKSFRQVIIFRESTKHLLKLIDLILNVVLAAHILSICWYQLHQIQRAYGVQNTWMQKYGIEDTTGLKCYVYSLYWAVTTMTTVGYGDIVPSNTYEALFTIITMIIMSCVFAYSINNVGMILQEIQKTSTELNSEINTISKFLDRRHVKIELISRVRHYLTFLSEEQKERNKEAEDQIFNKLSNKLRQEITIEINQQVLNKSLIFNQNFGQKTITRLLQIMQEITVAPNEVIFNENQCDDFSLYFIQSGQIQIYHSKNTNTHVIQTLNGMQIFGEISFFSGLARKASAKSIGLSTLFKVKREDFIEILQEQQEDFEMYKMIQEKIVLQNDYSYLSTQCFQCGNSNHISKNCNVTHYSYDPVIITLRKNFSIAQRRLKFDRRRKTSEFHPWQINQL